MLRIVAGGQPDRAIVALFCADDFAGRVCFVSGEQLEIAIIRTDNVEQIGESIVVVVADVRPKERLGDRTRRIRFVKDFNQALEDLLCEISLRGVANLIARAIENDAGVIAIAPYCVTSVDPRPLSEEEMIVAGVLGQRPTIKHLIHHQQAHPVAQIEELRRRRIVSRANGVYANLLQDFEATFPCAPRNRCSKSAGIMMEAHHLELDIPTVEPETASGIEMKLANSEGGLFFVHDRFPRDYSGQCSIKNGVVEIPPPGIPD